MNIYVNGHLKQMAKEKAIELYEDRYDHNGRLEYSSRHYIHFEKNSEGEEYGIVVSDERAVEDPIQPWYVRD